MDEKKKKKIHRDLSGASNDFIIRIILFHTILLFYYYYKKEKRRKFVNFVRILYTLFIYYSRDGRSIWNKTSMFKFIEKIFTIDP